MHPNPYPDDQIDMDPTSVNPAVDMEPLQPLAEYPQYPPTAPPLQDNVVRSPDDVESAETAHEEAHAFAYLIAKANDYLGWILLVLEVTLGLRFLLRLIGADPHNPFAIFLYGLTDALLFIFHGIVPDPTFGATQNHAFEWSTLIGMLVYGLIFTATRRFLHIVISRPEDPAE